MIPGTASADTAITSVSVSIDSGGWSSASFTSSDSITWTCSWTGLPQSGGTSVHTISVQATDAAAKSAEETESVTLYNVHVYYVDSTGNDSNDGSGWGPAHALATVSAAATAAGYLAPTLNSDSSGNDIWVAAGFYPDSAGGGRVTVNGGTEIYGGFAGTETAREQRNPAVNTTVLDGCQTCTVVSIGQYALASDTVVDGFTIQNGLDSGGYGGGICCDSAAATVSNCVIQENTAAYGGGLWTSSDSSPSVSNCVITGNTADDGSGGGICCTDGTPSITNCVISGNASTQGGGGICTNSCFPAVISGCTITGNSVPLDYSGGGVFCNRGGVSITGCTITDNLSHGICCAGFGSATITGNTIAGNCVAGDSAYEIDQGPNAGGGIYCYGSEEGAPP